MKTKALISCTVNLKLNCACYHICNKQVHDLAHIVSPMCSFFEIGHDIFQMPIFSLPLIQSNCQLVVKRLGLTFAIRISLKFYILVKLTFINPVECFRSLVTEFLSKK